MTTSASAPTNRDRSLSGRYIYSLECLLGEPALPTWEEIVGNSLLALYGTCQHEEKRYSVKGPIYGPELNP
jgi:hypothetical protein